MVSLTFFFSRGRSRLIPLNGIDFEISSSQVNPTKKELISCPGSNYASRVFCIDCCKTQLQANPCPGGEGTPANFG